MIDDLPTPEWSAALTDLNATSPDAYNNYWNQPVTPKVAPADRDFASIDKLRTSGNASDQQLFQTWLNKGNKDVVTAYQDWSKKQEAAKDALEAPIFVPAYTPPEPKQPNANPDQWLADLPVDAQDKYLTGYDPSWENDPTWTGKPVTLMATDAEYKAFLRQPGCRQE